MVSDLKPLRNHLDINDIGLCKKKNAATHARFDSPRSPRADYQNYRRLSSPTVFEPGEGERRFAPSVCRRPCFKAAQQRLKTFFKAVCWRYQAAIVLLLS